jgi:anti-sigma factor RsiW
MSLPDRIGLPVDHLAQEAVAALVDGELPAGPAARAARHLAGCAGCRMAVQAQREAKEALHASADVAVPTDLLSRLNAIPFTTAIPPAADLPGGAELAAGPDRLVLSGPGGSFAVPIGPRSGGPRHDQRHDGQHDHARWLRRGLVGGFAVLGLGVSALALTLPAGDPAPARTGAAVATEHTGIVPPVVRTVTVADLPTAGGTP